MMAVNLQMNNDASINDKVRSSFIYSRGLLAQSIDVGTEDGVVRLSAKAHGGSCKTHDAVLGIVQDAFWRACGILCKSLK